MRGRPPAAEVMSAGPGAPAGMQPAQATAPLRFHRHTGLLLVALAALAACIGVTLLMGRDLNWDYFNYHGYAAWQWRQDRLAQDFFAAGVQGYLNPLPFLPLAAMQAMGWPSAAIACTFAAIQALNLVFVFLIARLLLQDAPLLQLRAALATVLGGATAVLWSQAGSTFIDATLSPLALAALWLLLRAPSRAALIGSGLLAGAGTGLKLTLVPYAVALVLAAAALPGPARLRLRRLLGVAAATAAGFLLTYGYWGWRLYREFGSPLFPLFNGVFKAPDYPVQSDQYLRFVPETLQALLAFPFRMALHESWVYTEVAAPDIRPAVALALGLAALVLAVRRWLRRDAPVAPAVSAAAPVTAPRPLQADAARARWRVAGVFIGVSVLLWLKTSSNGRYATPLFLLLGPIVWALCEAVAGLRAGRMLALLVTCLQLVHLDSAGSVRWNPQPWTREMLPVQMPASLRDTPHLFLTIGSMSESHLVAHAHPQSVFVNPIGMHSLPSDGPGWSRFTALRARWAGRTQVVFKGPSQGELGDAPVLLGALDDFIDRLGLVLVRQGCQFIGVNAEPLDLEPGPIGRAGDRRRLLACPAALKAEPDAELARRRALATRITDALAARCPRYFSPRATQVEGTREEWSRRYLQHDLFVYVSFDNDAISYRQERQAVAVQLGRVSNWEEDVGQFTCSLPHGGQRGVQTLAGEPAGTRPVRP